MENAVDLTEEKNPLDSLFEIYSEAEEIWLYNRNGAVSQYHWGKFSPLGNGFCEDPKARVKWTTREEDLVLLGEYEAKVGDYSYGVNSFYSGARLATEEELYAARFKVTLGGGIPWSGQGFIGTSHSNPAGFRAETGEDGKTRLVWVLYSRSPQEVYYTGINLPLYTEILVHMEELNLFCKTCIKDPEGNGGWQRFYLTEYVDGHIYMMELPPIPFEDESAPTETREPKEE